MKVKWLDKECEYCNGKSEFIMTANGRHSKGKIKIDGNFLLITVEGDVECGDGELSVYTVKYCPFCGRKL